MGKNSLRWYRLGLLGLGIFTLVLLIVLVVQATGAKQDNTTSQKAQEVADKLNDYTASHNGVPASLDSLKVSNVPSTISYAKLSSTSYKFCVTYKSASQDFGVSNITDGLTGAGLNSLGQGSPGSTSFDYGSSGYLYLPSTHKKGQTCQTIIMYTSSLGMQDYSTQSSASQVANQGSSGVDPGGGCQSAALTFMAGKVTSTSGQPSSGSFTLNLKVSGQQKSIQVTKNTAIYDSQCNTITGDELLADDELTVWFNSSDSSQTAPVSIVDSSF